jgi:DNA polymerase I
VTARPRLFLFDGSALSYRSYFAFIRNPLRNSQGLNTSGAFGFTRELLKILDKEKPDRAAVVFDVSKKTFRHKRYPDYKATRARMPDEMLACLPYIDRIVDGLGVPRLGVEGFEADDVIGTLARQAAKKGYDVSIVSGDKDFCQLVNERVHIYNPWKGGPRGVEILDSAKVKVRHGVAPEQFRDYLALTGDSSDNVPGVPGVGPKRAVELIDLFGSLEGVLERAEEYPRKAIREKILASKDLARLSYELVTIETEMDLEQGPDDLVVRDPDRTALSALFSELEFREFSKRFTSDVNNDPHVHHRVTAETLDALVKKLRASEGFVFDLETTSLDPHVAEIVGMAFSFANAEAYYIGAEESLGESAFELFPVELDFKAHLAKLKPVLEDPSVPKGGQNVKYDVMVLANNGVMVQGVAFDTLLESYVLDPSGTHGLDSLAVRYLGYRKIATREVIGSGKTQRSMRDTPDQEIFPYASEDADITFRLHRLFTSRLGQVPALATLYGETELPLLPVLMKMEQTGIAIDVAALSAISSEFKERLRTLEDAIHSEAGGPFNLGSPKQLGAVLFEKLELHKKAGTRLRKTATGAISTNHEVLEELAETQPLAVKILEHRSLEKLLGTYVTALPKLVSPKTGRVHTSFNQAVTATGRLSSSHPNLQNIPIRTAEGRRIRSVFVPGESGWSLLAADYSQVELRVLAHLSADESLIATFNADQDVHAATASRIFDVPLEDVTKELRGRAKAINFGIVYGMGPNRLAHDTGLTVDEAKAFIANYFAKYPKIKGYLDGQVEHARADGYVETILGRRRPLVDIRAAQRMARANAERMALNSPIQGSAADIIKVAMIKIDRRLEAEGLQARMLLQVHDELLFEVPPEEVDRLEALVREEMEGAVELAVPLKVDIGRGANWLEAH